MTTIYLTDGRSIDKPNVTIKANGWVKAYDSISRDGCKKDYENLNHYPPNQVENVKGEVTYESPHGRV